MLNLVTKYGSRADAATAGFPEGSVKNATTLGAKNGTPLEKDWRNDKGESFPQSLLSRSGQRANNAVDTVTHSQAMNGLDMLKSNGTAPPNATPGDICAGMPTVDWADPSASPNYLNTSQTIRDSCIGWNRLLGEHFIFVVYGTSIAKVTGCLDYSAAPSIGSPLSVTWATTPDDILAICCDGDYLYVMWRETASNVMISKFAADLWTGVELWVKDTGYETYTTTPWSCRLCIADSGSLGVLIQDDSTSRIRMGVLDKGGLVFSASFFTLYKTDLVTANIISDGTYLYTIGRDEVSSSPSYDYALLRINIANPATQQITALVSALPSAFVEFPTGLSRVRGLILVTTMQGDLIAYNPSTGIRDDIFEALPYDRFLGTYGTMLGSDGENLHIQVIENEQSGNGFYSVFKVPIGEFLWEARRTTPDAVSSTRTRVTPITSAVVANNAPNGRLLFDRVDMWLVTAAGYVYRICNPGIG